ncbi:MAG: PIN domain-containing protein [Patescibacteria group bacterium]
MYLLDTNILIYFLQGKKEVLSLLNRLNSEKFAISMVSRLEFLNGLQNEIFITKEVEQYLDLFENITLDREIVRTAALFSFKSFKKLKFRDLIIAATAVVRNRTLITADKDFRNFPGLKLKLLKV